MSTPDHELYVAVCPADGEDTPLAGAPSESEHARVKRVWRDGEGRDARRVPVWKAAPVHGQALAPRASAVELARCAGGGEGRRCVGGIWAGRGLVEGRVVACEVQVHAHGACV